MAFVISFSTLSDDILPSCSSSSLPQQRHGGAWGFCGLPCAAGHRRACHRSFSQLGLIGPCGRNLYLPAPGGSNASGNIALLPVGGLLFGRELSKKPSASAVPINSTERAQKSG